MINYQITKTKILEAISLYRSVILDAAELELGESPTWPGLRARLLRALGDQGLTGKILAIFEQAVSEGGVQ